MLAFTTPSAVSTLLDDVEIWRELALTIARAASRLEEEFDRERDDVTFVVIDAFTELRDASRLEEDCERLCELALMVASRASTLEEDDETLKDEV